VAYREMFLTGVPPSATDKSGAGAEVAALADEMEQIVSDARLNAIVRKAAG